MEPPGEKKKKKKKKKKADCWVSSPEYDSQFGLGATPAHSICIWQPGDDTQHQITPIVSYMLSIWIKSYNRKSSP